MGERDKGNDFIFYFSVIEDRESMEIGKITIDGMDVVAIEEIRLDAAINCHAALQLVCLIDQAQMKHYVMLPERDNIITVRAEDKVIFCGTAVEAICRTKKGSTYLYLTLWNGSYLLDREKKSKSYQDTTMTYQELAQDKAVTVYAGEDKALGSIVVQYQETDWDFLVRMASRLSTGVYADMRQPKCVLYWGIGTGNTAEHTQIAEYTVEKDLDFYRGCVENASAKPTMEQCVTYEFECGEILAVGDAVLLDGKQVYITEVHCRMEQADLRGCYKARAKEGICYLPRYRFDMPGTALEGTVIDVAKDKVKVHLRIDEMQDKENAYWFPFSAMEASADGSGWYYMPELGDCVKVCIPEWDETDAFAVSAVSSYEGKDGATDMMADTNTMYMRNPSGKQMQMTPEQIKADGGDNKSFFEMDAEGNMILCADQSVSMLAMETMEIEARDVVEVKASKLLNLKTAMTGEILMNEAGELQHLGGHVNINREE